MGLSRCSNTRTAVPTRTCLRAYKRQQRFDWFSQDAPSQSSTRGLPTTYDEPGPSVRVRTLKGIGSEPRAGSTFWGFVRVESRGFRRVPWPMKSLSGRIAIVTGASAGIGEAVARDLADAGAKVVLNARREAVLERIAGDINEQCGAQVAAVVAGDCAEPATIGRLFASAAEQFGSAANLVVVNAGRGLNGSVATSDPQQWEDMARTNWLGAARLLRASAEALLAQASEADWLAKPRDVVVLGSTVGRNVSPFSSMYGSTKFAVHALAEGLRREIGSKGVRVTLIAPGFVASEFQGVAGYDPAWVKGVFDRIGPVLAPADVARTITFVASQPAHVHLNDIMLRPTRQDYP